MFINAYVVQRLTRVQAELDEQKMKNTKTESDFAEAQTALLSTRRQNRELHAQLEALKGDISTKAHALIEAEEEAIKQEQMISKVSVCFHFYG